MSRFNIWKDQESEEYFRLIALEIAKSYDIGYSEAAARVSDRFVGVRVVGDDHFIYWDQPEDWARSIVFGIPLDQVDSSGCAQLPAPSRLRAFLNSFFIWQWIWWMRRWWMIAKMSIRAGKFPLMWPRKLWRRITNVVNSRVPAPEDVE